MAGYVIIQHSVGYDGANRAADVIKVQQLLLELIIRKKIVRTGSVPLSALCDSSTIEAIRLFQIQFGNSAIPDGRLKPNGGTLQAMNKAAGYEYRENRETEWIYNGMTGLSISVFGGIDILSMGGGIAKIALYVEDSADSSNKFRVECYGGQISAGLGHRGYDGWPPDCSPPEQVDRVNGSNLRQEILRTHRDGGGVTAGKSISGVDRRISKDVWLGGGRTNLPVHRLDCPGRCDCRF